MSYLLPRLTSGWAVDQAITTEEDRLVIIRFGSDDSIECIQIDTTLAKLQERLINYCVIYIVDKVTEVTDFNEMYILNDDPMSIMFFYRNRHIQIDYGVGDNNKFLKADVNKSELETIILEVHQAALKGAGLAQCSLDFSSKHRF